MTCAYWQIKKSQNYIIGSKLPESEIVVDAIDDIHDSFQKHSWHVEEELVPFALLDTDLQEAHCEQIVTKLFSTEIPARFDNNSDRSCNRFELLDFDRDVRPELVPLIGKNS